MRPTFPPSPPRLLGLAILCVGAVTACADANGGSPSGAAPPAWNHDPDNATRGPTGWGQLAPSFEPCQAGEAQSPVDIAGTVTADLPPLEFAYTAVPLVVENTGHTVEVPMPDAADQRLTIGPDAYRLVQFHFHAPAEHTLEGRSFAAEVHLVHQDDAGELAVVGVFLDQAAPPRELADVVIVNAPHEAGEESEIDEERSPAELLPIEGAADEVSGFVTYTGSLTTPGCTEGVRWIVLSDPVGISSSAVELLHELIAGFPGYDGYANNNRPTQALNERQIEESIDR